MSHNSKSPSPSPQNAPPFHSLLSDCISVICQFHIFHVTEKEYRVWCQEDFSFLYQYAICWKFTYLKGFLVDKVFQSVKNHRGGAAPAKYLELTNMEQVTITLFHLIRGGIEELCLKLVTYDFGRKPWNLPEAIHCLSGIQKLYLEHESFPLRPGDLKHLKGIKELSMRNCVDVAPDDDEFRHLEGIQKLDLFYCEPLCQRMTDNAVKHLKGIQELNVTGFSRITTQSLQYLKGVQVLTIRHCPGIMLSAESMQHLSGVRILDVLAHTELTDEALEPLKGSIQELNISYCAKITGQGFSYIQDSIQRLTASCCPLLSDESFQYLHGVKQLNISLRGREAYRLSNKAYSYLTNVQDLNVMGRSHDSITKEVALYLRNVKSLAADGCPVIEKALKIHQDIQD